MAEQCCASSPFGEARRNMIAICTGLCAALVVQTMLLVTIPLYALSLGASPAMTGAILSLPYLLPLLFAIAMGGAVTRFGARNVLILGAAGLGLSPTAVLIAPGYLGVVLAQLLSGLGHTLMVLAAQSTVASLGSGRSLEKYFGWYAMFVSVGQLVGPVLAGWLIDFSGMDLSFRVMIVLSLTGFVSGFFLVGGARRAQKTEGEAIFDSAQIRLLISNSGIQLSLAVTVAVVFALGAVTNFLPVYLENLELPATTIGALLSFRALCSVVVRPFTPLIVDLARGRPRAMILSVAGVGVGLMFTGMTSSVFLLGGLMALVGLGCGVSQPLSMVVLAENAPRAQRASAFGLRLTANRSVQFLAPLVVGFLAGHTNFSVAFLVAGVVVSASLIAITRLVREEGAAQRGRR